MTENEPVDFQSRCCAVDSAREALFRNLRNVLVGRVTPTRMQVQSAHAQRMPAIPIPPPPDPPASIFIDCTACSQVSSTIRINLQGHRDLLSSPRDIPIEQVQILVQSEFSQHLIAQNNRP